MLDSIGTNDTRLYVAPPRMGGRLLAYLRAGVAFVRVVLRPQSLPHVINFVDALSSLPVVSEPIAASMRQHAQGTRALAERTRVGPIDIEGLLQLPSDSLGHRYASHLRANGLDPGALPARRAKTDVEYVSAHLYETHDIWHAVTGFGTDEAGELGLQAFYLAQIPSRVAVGILAIGMVQTLFKGFADREARVEQITRGWRMGKQSASLVGVDWKALWGVPLAEVQQTLRLAAAS